MAFTYSTAAPMSIRDTVRLLIGDTNSLSYIFEDEELDTIILLSGSRPYASAALAYETWARDGAKLLKRTTYGDETKERYSIADLLALAKSLRAAEITGGPVIGKLRDRANYDPNYPQKHWVMPSGVVPVVPIETDLGNTSGE